MPAWAGRRPRGQSQRVAPSLLTPDLWAPTHPKTPFLRSFRVSLAPAPPPSTSQPLATPPCRGSPLGLQRPFTLRLPCTHTLQHTQGLSAGSHPRTSACLYEPRNGTLRDRTRVCGEGTARGGEDERRGGRERERHSRTARGAWRLIPGRRGTSKGGWGGAAGGERGDSPGGEETAGGRDRGEEFASCP